MRKQVHIVYAGRVQGVGFRMTAEETAKRYGVAGWVKNLQDGRVEIMAEAEEEVLMKFLKAVRTGPMRNFIQDFQAAWSEAPDGGFDDFEIRYF